MSKHAEATRKGVEAEIEEDIDAADDAQVTLPGDEAAEKKVSEREQRLAEIVKATRAERDEQAGVPVADVEKIEADGDAVPTVADAEDMPVFKRGDKWMTKVKVDGVEREIPFDDYRTITQKNMAADARLEEASKIEGALRQKALLLKKEEERILAAPRAAKAPVEQAPSKDAPDPKLVAKGIISKIFSGDEDAATEMLSSMLQGRTPATPVDVEGLVTERIRQIEPQIAQRAAEQATKHTAAKATQTELRKSLAQFTSTHKEIAGDPIWMEVANLETTRIIKEKTNLSLDEFVANYDTAGISAQEIWDETAKRVKERMGSKPVDRLARKRDISGPAVGATATVPVVPDKVEPSREQYRENALNAIRKARGQ